MVTRKRGTVAVFSDEDPKTAAESWHLNKGIPVVWLVGSIMLTIVQGAGLVWYASQFNTRVDVVEKTLVLMAPQGERLTRLEEKVGSLQSTANRIENLLTIPRPR